MPTADQRPIGTTAATSLGLDLAGRRAGAGA